MINLTVAVHAFAKSVIHVFGVETGARVHREGDVYAIGHRNDITHAYPREFNFRQEFVAVEGEPDVVVAAVRKCLNNEGDDHVLYAFSTVVAEKISAYRALGYEHAWNNALMGVLLDDAVPKGVRGLHVREVQTTADVIAYQELTGSAAVVHSLSDSHIHSFLCTDDHGAPVGRSQLITKVDLFGYVSGMFTLPAQRRRGVGTVLMHAMHRRARDVGARFCLLIPSRFATEVNFYPRFQYETVAPHAVFIPNR